MRGKMQPKWTNVCAKVGNRVANQYYEARLPRDYRRPTEQDSREKIANWIRNKYIRKDYVPRGRTPPGELVAQGYDPEVSSDYESSDDDRMRREDRRKNRDCGRDDHGRVHDRKRDRQDPPRAEQSQSQQATSPPSESFNFPVGAPVPKVDASDNNWAAFPQDQSSTSVKNQSQQGGAGPPVPKVDPGENDWAAFPQDQSQQDCVDSLPDVFSLEAQLQQLQHVQQHQQNLQDQKIDQLKSSIANLYGNHCPGPMAGFGAAQFSAFGQMDQQPMMTNMLGQQQGMMMQQGLMQQQQQPQFGMQQTTGFGATPYSSQQTSIPMNTGFPQMNPFMGGTTQAQQQQQQQPVNMFQQQNGQVQNQQQQQNFMMIDNNH